MGHGSLYSNNKINNTVGFILHSVINNSIYPFASAHHAHHVNLILVSRRSSCVLSYLPRKQQLQWDGMRTPFRTHAAANLNSQNLEDSESNHWSRLSMLKYSRRPDLHFFSGFSSCKNFVSRVSGADDSSTNRGIFSRKSVPLPTYVVR